MLVLTRKKNESIMIGHDIEITIVSIDKDQIRIGINAPKHVDIHRKEVYIAIQEANKESQAGAKAFNLMDKMFPNMAIKPTIFNEAKPANDEPNQEQKLAHGQKPQLDPNQAQDQKLQSDQNQAHDQNEKT